VNRESEYAKDILYAAELREVNLCMCKTQLTKHNLLDYMHMWWLTMHVMTLR